MKVTLFFALLVGLLLCIGCSSQEAAPKPFAIPPVTLMSSPEPTMTSPPPLTAFDGATAFDYLVAQTDIGVRYPGSPGHLEVRDSIVNDLEAVGWAAERQTFMYTPVNGTPFEGMNIIGRQNVGKGNIIILGAHYDTRAVSNMSADKSPGLGAVDGASGVAVLLEMARTLNLDQIDNEIWLAFFDLEDNGSNGIERWQWIIGSTHMAQNLGEAKERIEAVVVVDMIGDADQTIYLERNSDQTLQGEIWQIAAELGYSEQFINQPKYTIIDDHLPFAQQGIVAIDIIDFDYKYWHTIEDTPDKASAESLFRVGHTLQTWLENK